MGRHNNDSPQKKRREARRAERVLARQRRRAVREQGVLQAQPEGTGWTGCDDLQWSPVREQRAS
jgi:hypothetical protein